MRDFAYLKGGPCDARIERLENYLQAVFKMKVVSPEAPLIFGKWTPLRVGHAVYKRTDTFLNGFPVFKFVEVEEQTDGIVFNLPKEEVKSE